MSNEFTTAMNDSETKINIISIKDSSDIARNIQFAKCSIQDIDSSGVTCNITFHGKSDNIVTVDPAINVTIDGVPNAISDADKTKVMQFISNSAKKSGEVIKFSTVTEGSGSLPGIHRGRRKYYDEMEPGAYLCSHWCISKLIVDTELLDMHTVRKMLWEQSKQAVFNYDSDIAELLGIRHYDENQYDLKDTEAAAKTLSKNPYDISSACTYLNIISPGTFIAAARVVEKAYIENNEPVGVTFIGRKYGWVYRRYTRDFIESIKAYLAHAEGGTKATLIYFKDACKYLMDKFNISEKEANKIKAKTSFAAKAFYLDCDLDESERKHGAFPVSLEEVCEAVHVCAQTVKRYIDRVNNNELGMISRDNFCEINGKYWFNEIAPNQIKSAKDIMRARQGNRKRRAENLQR